MDLSYANVFEIFSMLPAKAICNIKTVCKPFFEYSEENYFKAKQAQNLLLKDDTCFIIQPDEYKQRYHRRIEVHPLPGEERYSGVSHNFMRLLSKSMRVLASNNGLLLCCTNNKDQTELFVCNPVTQASLPIPISGHYLGDNVNVNSNIVLECYKDCYNLILFEPPVDLDWHTSYICKVYRSKESVWKTMKQELIPGNRKLKFEMPVIHNGVVHFISDTGCYVDRGSKYYQPYIVSYDLDSGMSTMVKLPIAVVEGFEDASCNMGIFRWGKVWSSRKSICLVRSLKSVFTVWYMEEAGENPRWRMVLKVGVNEMGLNEIDPDVKGFMVMNGDLLVFATGMKVYSCGLSDERYMEIEEICKHSCGCGPTFLSYSNTLRPTF